jgi:hypothetical protein
MSNISTPFKNLFITNKKSGSYAVEYRTREFTFEEIGAAN